MVYTNSAKMKFKNFKGKGDLEYSEEENRFTVRKRASDSASGAVVGVMFGALGQAVMNGMSTGKEVGSFTPGDIQRAEISEGTRKNVYYLYPHGEETPYEFVIETETMVNTQLYRIFVEQPQAAPEAPVELEEYDWDCLVVNPQEVQTAQIPAPAAAPAPVQPQPPKKPCALLCLRSGPLAGRIYEGAPGSTLVIGRDAARCTVALPQYGSVSGTHCRLDIGEGCLRITDLGSSNGTFLDGKPLKANQGVVVRGGTMLLGNQQCEFYICFE